MQMPLYSKVKRAPFYSTKRSTPQKGLTIVMRHVKIENFCWKANPGLSPCELHSNKPYLCTICVKTFTHRHYLTIYSHCGEVLPERSVQYYFAPKTCPYKAPLDSHDRTELPVYSVWLAISQKQAKRGGLHQWGGLVHHAKSHTYWKLYTRK